jgi:hypothetical protein
MIERKGYHRSPYRRSDGTYVRGTYVHPTKIKSTRAPGEREVKREKWEKSVERKRKSRQISPKKGQRCPKGYIMREGYVRKTYSRQSRDGSKRISVKRSVVPPTCIKDVGKKGKGVKKIGPLKQGTLEQFGYENVMAMSKEDRYDALSKAVKKLGWLPVFRKLNAVAVLNRNTNPKLSDRFFKDRDWVKKNYEGFRPE